MDEKEEKSWSQEEKQAEHNNLSSSKHQAFKLSVQLQS